MGNLGDGAIPELVPGRVVRVRKGHDAGLWCVVVGTDPESGRVLLVDGSLHPVDRPKRKNPKHLQVTRTVLEDVAARLASGKSLDNGWLARRIAALRDRGDAS